MKSKPDFDPMFPTNRRRVYGPIRSIGLLAIALTVAGLALRAGPIPTQRRMPPPWQLAPIPGGYIVVQGGAPSTRTVGMPPRDGFVIVAPAEIDPAMVVQARGDLDAAMVFNPETRHWGSTPVGPAPGIDPTMPGFVPAPGAEGYRPVPGSPNPPITPRPR